MAEQKKGGLSPIAGIVVGLILMFAGMWVSKNWHPEFLKQLEEGGIPLDPGKTVAVIGVMLILFPVIRMFFIDPLMEAVNGRNSELEKTFTEVETLRAEMTQMKGDYEKRLVETEASAREQIQSQIREAQELRKTLMAEASAKADELLRKAQEDIQAEKARALTEIRVHVATLSLGAAEKLLGENMDSDKNRRLIDDFLATTEAQN